MNSLETLLIADDKPGHYHLSEGVIAALERVVDIKLTRMNVKRHWWAPGRLLSYLSNNKVSDKIILKFGYDIRIEDLPAADLVISAGGNTLAANIVATRALGADNIFIGSLRRFPPEDFNLVITSFERLAHLPRHLVCLKPNKLDPDTLNHPDQPARFGNDTPPVTAGLLLGGNTPQFKYTDEEWQKCADFIDISYQRWGTKWLVSNSRRTPDKVSDLFSKRAAHSDSPITFIDYRHAGPGSLHRIFETANIILCTEDSSTMISEAIAAQLPVVGLVPDIHQFTPQEKEYRQYLQQNNWTKSISLATLDLEILNQKLSQIIPMKENHLDILAEKLKQRLPDLLT